MKKKPQSNFIVQYRDVDPYTGHIDDEGETCRTETEEAAQCIIAALLDFNTTSREGNPRRQYIIKQIVPKTDSQDDDRWWTW